MSHLCKVSFHLFCVASISTFSVAFLLPFIFIFFFWMKNICNGFGAVVLLLWTLSFRRHVLRVHTRVRFGVHVQLYSKTAFVFGAEEAVMLHLEKVSTCRPPNLSWAQVEVFFLVSWRHNGVT